MITHTHSPNQKYALMLDILSDMILNHASKLVPKDKVEENPQPAWSFFLQKLDQEADDEMNRELTAQLLGTHDYEEVA